MKKGKHGATSGKAETAPNSKALLAGLAGLAGLPIAFALFDGKRRLAAWNAPLAALGLFPKALLRQGASLAQFQRHDAGLKRKDAGPHEVSLASGKVYQGSCRRVPPGQLLIVYEDVTEARLAAQRYDIASRAINEGVYDWDIAGGRTYYSERVVNAVGMTPKELRTAADWFKRFHPEDRPRFEAALVAHFKGQTERFECDYRYRARDGEWRWARQHGIAIRDARGRAVRMIGSTGDINELKQGELALVRAHEETAEALERQTATAEILKVIAASPSDVQPVFDAIAESAKRLFGGQAAVVTRVVGDMLHVAALTSTSEAGNEAVRSLFPRPLSGPNLNSIVARNGVPVFRADMENDPEAPPEFREMARKRGYRSILGVPMLREGVAVGTISVTRSEPGNFTEHQINLLKTFADQAVIAIENVRLFNETREALERQTATAEILKVIASSPADVQPAFDAIVHSAMKLVNGHSAAVARLIDGTVHLASHTSTDPDGDDALKRLFSTAVAAETSVRGVFESGRPEIQADIETDPDVPPALREMARARGWRSRVLVPMMRGRDAIGVISVTRREPGSFAHHHVDLLKIFADQAVIAIENVRLFNETKEALEQQRASAEVLSAISASIGDTAPVFDKILENCERLFAGRIVGVNVIREDGLLHLGAYHGAHREEFEKIFPMPVTSGSGSALAITERRIVHYPDAQHGAEVPETTRRGCTATGIHSVIFAPMLREGRGLGAIFVGRDEIGPIPEREIALLKSFADQAAIAIENARLFNETREALERQTATADILAVISSSPTDLRPIFDAVLRNATTLCGAHLGILNLYDGEKFTTGAQCGGNPEFVKWLFERGPWAPVANTAVARMIAERQPVQVLDSRESASYREGAPVTVKMVDVGGARTFLTVPLIKEGKVIGNIGIYRPEVRAFTDRQIALVRTFADQAVIAIENVRLFNETKEALERQTATAEILKVIASSPSDVQPVFDAIVSGACRLIKARVATVARRDGDTLYLGAYTRAVVEDDATESLFPVKITGQGPMGRSILDRKPAVVTDVETFEGFSEGFRKGALKRGNRSMLSVPLLRGNEAIGAINVSRSVTGSFTEHEMGLLTSFADQAVIAIENVRLFNETKEALERQTATAEILKVISSSPTDAQPVFEAIVQSGLKLFSGNGVGISIVEGAALRVVATAGNLPSAVKGIHLPISRESASGMAIVEKRVANIRDTESPDAPAHARDNGRKFNYRSQAMAPMFRDGEPVGVVGVTLKDPGGLDDKQLALLTTFADQAVIAIENVRLFKELEARNRDVTDSLERQTATAEILRVISSSPADIQPVFDAVTHNAARLCSANDVVIRLAEGGTHRAVAHHGSIPPVGTLPVAGSIVGRAMLERKPFQIADLLDPSVRSEFREADATTPGYRTFLAAPLVRENIAIGAIVMRRIDVAPFTGKQIALLQTFADQAVIAIENVRLFNETREALERQTATAEILKVISESPTNVQPVFDAIVKSAGRLAAPGSATISMLEGGRLHLNATHVGEGSPPDIFERVGKIYPLPFDPERVLSARAIVERKIVEIVDAAAPESPEFTRKAGQAGHFRSATFVPLVRGGEGIGTLIITYPQSGIRMTANQLALLQTFASQAVIAIENVRLFNETKESLERQTATAEILKVIASSPSDVQPVFDAIVRSSVRLAAGATGGLFMSDGKTVNIVSQIQPSEAARQMFRQAFPVSIDHGSPVVVAIRECRMINIPDLLAEDWPEEVKDRARAGNYRAMILVPLIREGSSIGSIAVTRREPGAFGEAYVDLLKTFADQAVIAIENVRLFKELESRTEALTKSVGQLTALGEVGQAISSTLDLETVLKTIVSHAMRLTGLDAGVIYEYDEPSGTFELRASENFDDESVAGLRGAGLRKGEGAVGTSVVTREPVQVHDTHAPDYPARLRALLDRPGFRAILAVPLLREDQTIGALMMLRNAPGEFAPDIVDMLKTFASQSALAIQNARLFREIAEKGKQLEQASQHKSNFLASMSHELRTPLNAILGFNEMILGQVYGEVPADMQEPLADIQTSGKHLLRLINNVLDLAKIEAGRMELSLQDYSVHDTVASVHATLRPLAADKGLEFLATVPNDVPLAYGDGGRITQCLMNLAGNSIKFTKAGKVEISAAEKDGLLTYRVADTGIGIPPDKIASLFTEFKQTDATIASEYGGTGLGLSISKKFVEMHGGRIWIESELGKGSTFIIEIPLRVTST